MTSVIVQPLYPNRADVPHVTLAYGCDRGTYEKVIGLPVTLGITAHAWNGEVQALRCVLPTWLHCQVGEPHLTLSWVNGSAPVKASLMLENEHQEEEMQLAVHCMIEFFEWQKRAAQQ